VFNSLSVCLIACLLLSGCTEDNPLQPVPKNPQIVLIQAPDRVYQFPASPVGIHVRADDPQGVKTLAGVQLSVRRINLALVASFEMRDDGRNGDILPGDGQYFLPIDTALVHGQTGDFILEAVARDRSGLESDVARDTITIIAGRENLLPKLLEITVPKTIAGDSLYAPLFRATVTDADGLASLRIVRIEFFPPAFPASTLVDSLFDDGQHQDGLANDGVFARAIPTTKLCGAGLFSVVLHAVDAAGGKSPAAIATVNVTRLGVNFSPLLSDLRAPAEISRSRTPNTYLLSVQASDPNCIADLKRVFFNSFLPNGNPSSGNPFLMRDDGQQGDAVAGDGQFSLTIQIPPTTATGNYRFEFQAEDKKGALSAKLDHIITVIE
jgi:hypothetical protein